MRHRLRDIAARTILTGMIGGAITGVVTLLLFLLGAMFTAPPGTITLPEPVQLLVRLLSSSLFAAVVGLVAGALLALLALPILLPAGNWAAVHPRRAQVIGAVSCSWPVLPLSASLAAFDGAPTFWDFPPLVVPVVMAVGIGAFRGPDLIIRW